MLLSGGFRGSFATVVSAVPGSSTNDREPIHCMHAPSSPRPRRAPRPRAIALLAVLAYAVTWLVNRSLRRVEGPSMLPSLWPDDLLLTVPAAWVTPRAGDVVVAEVGGRRVTKRLAARPGERAELRDGHLWVGGRWWVVPDAVVVDEEVVWDPADDEVVLLGDHRARSTDARAGGPVTVGTVDRVALARVAPPTWLRGRARPYDGARLRPGVRLVVLDPDDRVLLFRVTDASGGDATWWEAPGGGRHPGEPPWTAARRELAEEVGATAVEPVPLGGTHVRVTTLLGAPLRKVEDLLAVRVPTATVDARGWSDAERRDITEHRWWTLAELDELAATGPGLVPDDLPALARSAVEALRARS